jgi:hypothetical protein
MLENCGQMVYCEQITNNGHTWYEKVWQNIHKHIISTINVCEHK